jgi:hypothetical protein
MEALQEEIHLDDEVEEGELPERRGMLIIVSFYCVIA